MGVKEVRERHGAVETSLLDWTSTFRAHCAPAHRPPLTAEVPWRDEGQGLAEEPAWLCSSGQWLS